MEEKCILRIKKFSSIVKYCTILISISFLIITTYFIWQNLNKLNPLDVIIIIFIGTIIIIIFWFSGFFISDLILGFSIIIQNNIEEITKRKNTALRRKIKIENLENKK